MKGNLVHSKTHQYHLMTAGIGILVIAGSSYLLFNQYSQQKQIEQLLAERYSFLSETSSSTLALSEARSTIAALQEELFTLKSEFGPLNDDSADENERNDDFQKQIKKFSMTVGVL